LVNKLIYRRFKENDLRSLLDLLRSSFNGYPSIDLWEWKYSKNPHGSPLIWVAEDKGRIVGCYILNPVKLRIGRNLVMGAQSVDAAVDNSYRGGGIFKKLASAAIAEASSNGINLIYAFPTEISYKGQIRIGCRPMFMIPKMYRVFRIGSLLEKSLDIESSSIKRVVGILDAFQGARARKVSAKSDFRFELSSIKEFDSTFEIFWEEISEKNNSVLVERDLSYLNWRYIAHPEKQYKVCVCKKDTKIVGYAVFNVERTSKIDRESVNQISVGNIIDLITLPNMASSAYPLISAACNYFEHEHVDIAGCWMTRWHPLHSMLAKFGFSDFFELLRRTVSRSKIGSYLIYYVTSQSNITSALRSMQIPSEYCWWYLMQGDTDFA
jgi:L-amino acid N-acyltransferase YncA